MTRTIRRPRIRRREVPLALRLLPLPDAAVRQRMIGYHITLSNLRSHRGDLSHFVTMAQVIVSTSHLFDAGFGSACIEGLTEAHDALEQGLRAAVATGVWAIDQSTFELFADLLALHEQQLCTAPLDAVNKSVQMSTLSGADRVRSIHQIP